MFQKLAGRIALYGLAPQVSKIASFFVLPIITKDLTAQDYGIAGIVTAYSAAFTVFQNLGMNVVLSNSFYKSPNFFKWHWRQIHGFLSLWAIVFAIILAALLYLVIPEETGNNKWPIIALNFLSVALFATSQNITFRFYHLSGKARLLAVRTALVGIITVLVNLYTISYLKLGYMGWFISAFVGTLVSFLIFSYPIYVKYKLTPIFNFKKRTIRHALNVSLPTIPHYYSSYFLNMSDRAVMDVINVKTTDIGLYNLAYTFGNYYSSLVDAISLAVSPTYLKLYKGNNTESRLAIQKLTYVLQSGLLLLSFLLCIWMKEVFQLVIKNPGLQSAYPIAVIIVMSYNYRPMYLAAISKIFFMEKTKKLWRVSFMAGLINVTLNFIFIPLYGITAAAIITFASYMYMGYSGFFLREYKLNNPVKLYPLIWFLLTILLLIVSFSLIELDVIFKVLITAALMLISAVTVMMKRKYFDIAI